MIRGMDRMLGGRYSAKFNINNNCGTGNLFQNCLAYRSFKALYRDLDAHLCSLCYELFVS